MPWNRVSLIIAASALALIALIFLQVKWMQQSRELIEEQFEQKVQMALCSAVEKLSAENNTAKSCAIVNKRVQCLQEGLDSIYSNPDMVKELKESLVFYGIDLDFEIDIINQQSSWSSVFSPQPIGSSYCCSLSPITKTKDQVIAIVFPGKPKYILKKMSFMLGSSILILLAICTVFLLANYTLLRQKRMAQINKDFFNNMAHEFRTPLTNIALATNLLQKKKKELQDDQFIQVVQRENEKLSQQVERVLHLAELENGHYQLQKEQLNLGNLIREVVAEMEVQIKNKGATIDIQMQEEDLVLFGDKFHLSNAFRNLLDNALKYGKDHPEITIAVNKSHDGLKILFQDNGIGISRSDQQLVFDKFHRVGGGDLHQAKGFGLGLSYVKMIVELHKGAIKVFSELNKGSRFDLFLPKTC